MKKICTLFIILLFFILLASCTKSEKEHVHDFVLVPEKAPTCVEIGHKEYYECKECGEKSYIEEITELADHQYEYVESNEATKDLVGYDIYECKVCHERKNEYKNALNREEEEMKEIKILLIGNSLTNYNTLMNCFKGVANGEGYDVIVDKCAYGNQYLYDYVEGPDGDYFMSLFNKVFHTRYDLAILQDCENNIMLAEGNSFDSFRKVTKYLEKFKVKSMIYETYPYNKGICEAGLNYEETIYKTDGKMKAIANELGISVSRVGIGFLKITNEGEKLPLYNSDGVHPSSYGTYLTALIHTATVFGKRLENVSYKYNDYIKDKSITWHCENELVEISDEMQKYLEDVANYAAFDFELDSKYNYSSLGISEEEGTYNGFKKEIVVDKEATGEINLDYKQTSGTWKVTDKNSFINTSDKAVLMFQKDLIENKDEECVLSFDICIKEELEECTYARGIILGCENKDMTYFDGSDALIIGRYNWSDHPHLTAMRVWDPTKFPQYNYKSGYTFNRGFYFKDIEKPVMEVNKTYHIQITINANEQRYGYYVDGVLYAYVIGYDLAKGGYFGILSYEANKIEYSNFKFNGKKLVFNN